MNRVQRLLVGVVFVALSSGQAMADGQYGETLKSTLQEVATGNCPETLLTPLVRGACLQQLSNMKARLASLGAIQSTQFLGNQQTPNGPAEVYQVIFTHGAMTWMVAADSQGKLTILWSPG